jgi:hypothetical protein
LDIASSDFWGLSGGRSTNPALNFVSTFFGEAQSNMQQLIDVRFDHHGGFNSKIRSVHSGDSVVITMPADLTLLVLSLDSLRRQLTQDMWHGFRLTVTADQQCEMMYNYDPNCADDPTFYVD